MSDQSSDGDAFAPLFASDLASEVRETFEEMVGFGASVVAATQETVHRFDGAIQDARDGPVVIITLAVLQIRHGVIFSSIRDAAIEAIDEGAAERLTTQDAAGRRQIRELLGDLRDLLESLPAADSDDEDED